jgi:hypothetical protein
VMPQSHSGTRDIYDGKLSLRYCMALCKWQIRLSVSEAVSTVSWSNWFKSFTHKMYVASTINCSELIDITDINDKEMNYTYKTGGFEFQVIS